MNVAFENGRHVVELRPSGPGRWIAAGFLCFWLTGWAMGEVAGVGLLLGSVSALVGHPVGWLPPMQGPAAVPAALFALVWVSFWTLGGVLAAGAVLRLLWGSERIEWDGAGVRRVTRIGPFAWTREFAREELRGVGVRRAHLVLETRRGVVTLTRLGDHGDHLELSREIEKSLALGHASVAIDELPKDWEAAVDSEGAPVLRRSPRRRRGQAVFLGLVFGVLAAFAVVMAATALRGEDPLLWIPAAIVTLFAAAAGASAAWLGLGGEAIRLRPGQADVLGWIGPHRWLASYQPPSLALDHTRDSDGDDCYRLVLRGPERSKTIAQVLHEPYELARVGRWMAAKLGCELRLPSHLQKQSDAA